MKTSKVSFFSLFLVVNEKITLNFASTFLHFFKVENKINSSNLSSMMTCERPLGQKDGKILVKILEWTLFEGCVPKGFFFCFFFLHCMAKIQALD